MDTTGSQLGDSFADGFDRQLAEIARVGALTREEIDAAAAGVFLLAQQRPCCGDPGDCDEDCR